LIFQFSVLFYVFTCHRTVDLSISMWCIYLVKLMYVKWQDRPYTHRAYCFFLSSRCSPTTPTTTTVL